MKVYFSHFIFRLIILVLLISDVYSQKAGAINVQPINEKQLEKLIKGRNGKPLLLNIWATWCIPCREEFPALVKLQDKFKGKIDLVAISTDEPEDIREKIIPFLEKVKINFRVYINNFKVKPELIDFLEKEWNGALPATFIYDSKGVRKYFFQGGKSYEEFLALLENL